MPSTEETVIDFITGRSIPNEGAEANRQHVEHLLVQEKGYAKADIEVDAPIRLTMDDGEYCSLLDLVVRVKGRRYMVIKCAPGALASREREVVAAARLLDEYQIPFAVASDGKSAILWETISGKIIGKGIDAIPSKSEAEETFDPQRLLPLAEARRTRQQLIFRSYDAMNIHRRGARRER